uniref:GDP-L-galactose phosphorylase 2-like n=1 Tax=Tanacetum cinerariifolium TaxID=118510 RepID=A0A699J486_TANCI|nr:GDP-L-galactose phosphorylase 2-like [Tanacetum cinerariifolium]
MINTELEYKTRSTPSGYILLSRTVKTSRSEIDAIGEGMTVGLKRVEVDVKCEDRVERGLFRYDVTACETKVIPEDYGFVAQLNEGRHLKKRPTEFYVDKVLQPAPIKAGKSSSVVAININKSVKLNMDTSCFLFLEFLSVCLKGLTTRASCLHGTWQRKLGIHTFVWVTIVLALLLLSIIFTSRLRS